MKQTIKPLNNYLLIKPHLNTDEIKLGKIDLRIDTSFEREKHAPTYGEVVAVPNKLIFKQKNPPSVGKPTPHFTMLAPDMYPESVSYDVDMEVEVGDTIYFHYLTKQDCESNSRVIKDDEGNTLYLVKYDNCFVVKRKDNIIPINGYVIAERISFKEKFSNLELPEWLKNKESVKYARIKYVGKHVRGYRGEHDICELNIDVKEGDIVVYDKNSDIPLQYSFHNNLEDDSEYIRMQRRDMSAIIPKETFEKLYLE